MVPRSLNQTRSFISGITVLTKYIYFVYILVNVKYNENTKHYTALGESLMTNIHVAVGFTLCYICHLTHLVLYII